MPRKRFHRLTGGLLAVGLLLPSPVMAQEQDQLAPYKMLRSLQFVQDTVVLGDHSAAEMQRFMLGTMDERLRNADSSVFEDVRNVDAALIYAMSGGNPATLEWLVARDVGGNFDSRVSDALRKYLSGKGTLIAKSLGEMVPEYRDSRIAPYLALVAGNVTIPRDPAAALKFYDWARLTAPGTIVEEAALRRSLAVALDAKLVPQAFGYAKRYVRRFLHSPYASQFADLFVKLTVEHYDKLDHEDIQATLDFMDNDRRREVYLRIARQAAIEGRNDLARMAADKAKALAGQVDDNLSALADLYGGLANIPTAEVGATIERISKIPDSMLTPSDRALRSAAETVAREVLRVPEADSFTQAGAPIPNVGNGEAISPDDPVADVAAQPDKAPAAEEQQDPMAPAIPVATPPTSEPPVASQASAEGGTPPLQDDPEFQSFVEKSRGKIEEIDGLLQQESTTK